jgi:hypothetical protein
MIKDKFGRNWRLPEEELCPECKQPDTENQCNHNAITLEEAIRLGAVMNFVATVYNRDEDIIKQFIIKDRTEWEADDEAEGVVGQVEGYDDWTLMPEEFWIKQGVSLEEVEEL